MKDKILNEMITHVPICTHKDPKNVLITSKNSIDIVNEIAKYKNIEAKVASSDTLDDFEERSFDVIICDEFDIKAQRLLKEDSLLVLSHVNLDDFENAKKTFEEIGKFYKIVMPFRVDCSFALLASKEYHPTADINLQRADLTDGYEVYNSDFHVGSFAMPTYLRKKYLGIFKN